MNVNIIFGHKTFQRASPSSVSARKVGIISVNLSSLVCEEFHQVGRKVILEC